MDGNLSLKTSDHFAQINEWYQTPLGEELASAIADRLEPTLTRLFGYHLLQLGIPDRPEWVSKSPIPHKICVLPDINIMPALGADNLFAEFSKLPFANGSIDVVLMPHILSYVRDPQEVISEVERILVPEGHLIIIGFNPFSLWGFGRLFMQMKKQAPWCNPYISTFRLRKYLSDFGFELIHLHSFFFRPPVNNDKALKKLLFLETIGRLCWPYPGGAYIFVAKKQLTIVTKIRPIWQFKHIIVGKNVAQPSGLNVR